MESPESKNRFKKIIEFRKYLYSGGPFFAHSKLRWRKLFLGTYLMDQFKTMKNVLAKNVQKRVFECTIWNYAKRAAK